MAAIAVEKLGRVGARVQGIDRDRLLHDDSFAAWCMQTLEETGALVFPGLHVDDATQVAFTRKLGRPVLFHVRDLLPEIYPVSLDRAKNPSGADYLRATIAWHFDGAQDAVPAKATLLSAKVLAESGGETEFASTYVAYDELCDEEKARFASLRVVHSLEGTQRITHPNPTRRQLEAWKRSERVHPLVWRHRDGRRSLLIGSTAVAVVGMEPEAGQALLEDLLARATTPDHVYSHTWSVGDLVIWDNCGVIHRVQPYDVSSAREMHRTTIEGDEPITASA
jgi:alpha-ketoglutarate-dependent taurine dioxygenase